MSVAAHPHAGLQTVTWLFEGEIEHRDSLGNIQLVAPGELNLMTAGRGISHSELSINTRSDLHGVQLWTALPDEHRKMEPTFLHYQDLPAFNWEGIGIRVFVGEFLGQFSPAKIFSPIVGAEIDLPANTTTLLPAQSSFEYGILVVSGKAEVNGSSVARGQLHCVPAGSVGLQVSSQVGAKLILLGGQPFTEKIVMWWNFIARTHEEIVQMRDAWQNQTSHFPDRIGGRIPAPALPNLTLKARNNPPRQ